MGINLEGAALIFDEAQYVNKTTEGEGEGEGEAERSESVRRKIGR